MLASDLVGALLVLLCVWSLLLLGSLVAPWTGVHAAALLSYVAAAGLLLATRGRAEARVESSGFAGALVAGYASFPAWVALAMAVGVALGLAPRQPMAPAGWAPLLWLALLVPGPLFEELLYRERLFDALRPTLGTGATILATSMLFALPHLERWQLVGTFLVGLGLGGFRALGGGVGACIGMHVGLNLASLTAGAPPSRLAPTPIVGAAAGLACTAWMLCRRAPRASATRRRVEPPWRGRHG